MVLLGIEFRPGLVSYFDPATLEEYGAHTNHPLIGDHPYVCVEVSADDSTCTWLPLSSQCGRGRHQRSFLPREYKCGHSRWIDKDNYFYDASRLVSGPKYAFQEASECERTREHDRNWVTEDGVGYIRRTIDM